MFRYSSTHKTTLEQYLAYIEMADRVSQRRGTMNTFFLSLHSGLIGLIVGLLGFSSGELHLPIVSAAGALIGLVLVKNWRDLLRSYRQLNGAKYKVVHDMERLLELAPYDVEWDYLKRGQSEDAYLKLTVAESRVPRNFYFGYVALLLVSIWLITREIV